MLASGSTVWTPRPLLRRGGSASSASPLRRSARRCVWLRAGRLQLHLTKTRSTRSRALASFSLEVDGFVAVYRWAVGDQYTHEVSRQQRSLRAPRAASCRSISTTPGGNVVEVFRPDAAR